MTDVDTFWDVQALTKSLCFTPPPPFPLTGGGDCFPFRYIWERWQLSKLSKLREKVRKNQACIYHTMKSSEAMILAVMDAIFAIAQRSRWGINQRWNDRWNGSYMNCGYEIKWSYDPRSYGRNVCKLRKEAWKFRTNLNYTAATSTTASAPFHPAEKNSINL